MFINAAENAIRPVLRTRGAIPVLCIGAAIAAIAPWGLPLGGLMAHAPVLRATSILIMSMIGIACGHRCGLLIVPQNAGYASQIAIAAAALMAAYLLLIDGFFFHTSLSKDYRAFIVTDGIVLRLVYLMLRSAAEVIVFQLAIGSTLVWLLGRAWHDADDRVAATTCVVGLMLAHLLNCALNLSVENGTIGYEALRFFAPGLMWAFLYRRFGLVAVLIAHSSTHIFFQPAIQVLM